MGRGHGKENARKEMQGIKRNDEVGVQRGFPAFSKNSNE